ncbi:hypothetical protein ES332_A09G164800v1 [Gossypium tomentosum]|uniref:Uncharacterized protein n=1 Tax=Gossypium tomentosum TaxID=34277 RepID=A0A5D2P3T8_GOSTO|nr:hypothetical protein ES332_A09G164800v1 [Gossypium tomentosum]
MMEIYSHHNYSLLKASMVVGNLVAPLIAHAFCNHMGLPVLFVPRKGLVSVAFVAGMLSFAWLLFPLTRPDLYNDRTNNCRCWQGFCLWN